MLLKRRAFLIESALGALALGCDQPEVPVVHFAEPPQVLPPSGPTRPAPDTTLARDLGRALDAAKRAGATYADARIHLRKRESIHTRQDHVVGVQSRETYGIGVRVLAFGAWGFAATTSVDEASADVVAQRAVAVARANSKAQKRAIELAPANAIAATWSTPLSVDPLKVPIKERAELLLSLWPEAKKVAGVAFLDAEAHAIDEWKLVATSVGSIIEQRIVRVGAEYTVTAKNDRSGEFVTRRHDLPPMQAGWEHITGSTFAADAQKIAEDAVEKLKAPSVDPGAYDLVLAPSNLWLTVHESVGHPTELDRILGYEADLAGTSFVKTADIGKLKYGSPLMTIVADKTSPGGLATCAYDDECVPTQSWKLVDGGILAGVQTTREQAGWIGEKESRGTSYAEHYGAIPFQRMPNVSLLPGNEKRSLDDIVAATDRGILVVGDGSWSIDQQRYNFQFGGQTFHRIHKGKVREALKDVAYQSNSLEFWSSLDMIGDKSTWEIHGTLEDGKGEPGQSNPVSHGCPAARFKQVNVLNTNRRSA